MSGAWLTDAEFRERYIRALASIYAKNTGPWDDPIEAATADYDSCPRSEWDEPYSLLSPEAAAAQSYNDHCEGDVDGPQY